MAQDPQIDVFNANIFLNTKFTHLWEPISPYLFFWINTVQYVPSGIMEGKKTHSLAAQPMNPRQWTPFPLRAGLCVLSTRCLTTWLENRPKLLLMIFALSLLIRVVTFYGLQNQLRKRKNGSLGNLVLRMWKKHGTVFKKYLGVRIGTFLYSYIFLFAITFFYFYVLTCIWG